MTSRLRLGATYLFSGYATTDANQRFQPEPGALSPVRDTVLFTSDSGAKANRASLVAWKTDGKGLIYPLTTSGDHRPTVVHYLESKRRFHVPPPDVLLQSWAVHRDKWAEKLGELLAKGDRADRGVELTEMPVAKKFLREPDRKSESETDKAWATFYDHLAETARLSAFVLPKTRAVLLLFGTPDFVKGRVAIVPPGKPEIPGIPIKRVGELTCAIVIGTPTSLPAGLYKIVVSLDPEVVRRCSTPVVRQGKYEIKEQVRFAISNFAGDFDIITCDPISLEESLLMQFPALYGHRVLAAKKRNEDPEIETNPEYKDFPKALDPWCDRLAWTVAKGKLSVGLINADSRDKCAKLLGKAVWEELEPKNELLKASKNTIDLAFQVRKNRHEWKELLEQLKAEDELGDLKQLLWKDLDGPFERYRWWKYVKKELVEGDKAKVLELASATEAERKAILRAGIPEKRLNLEEAFHRKAARAVEKGLVAAQLPLDVFKAAVAFNDVLETRKELRDLETDFDSLLRQVDSVLGRGASREGIGNLERMRTATVAAYQKLDDDEAEALMAAADAVLGALTLIGVGGATLAAIVLLRETAALGKEVVVDVAEWLDRVALKGMLNDLYAREWKQMTVLARASSSNQSLMPRLAANGGADDLHVQFRLRAEALHGLVGLLTRASVASKDDSEYLERIRKYRVAEYVQHYLLDEGWQFPLRPMVPISMDNAWMYLTGPYGAYRTDAAVREQLGFASPIKLGAVDALPYGMSLLTVVDSIGEGNAVAKFHGSFPIHRSESADLNEVAKAFRTAWRELEGESIDYTCVYRRPAGSSGDGGWEPVNAKAVKSVDQLDVLSPYDQIRVLLVLKDEVQPGCYPVSFQLYRTDGRNLSGPVYRDVTRRLGKELLPSESKFTDRIGCVFFPFYALGKQVVPGIKPLAGAASMLGATLYELLGYLHDMRYAFKVKVGDASEGGWLKIGAANAGRSDLDELRVGITGKPDEDRLLVADFLERESKDFEYPPLFDIGQGFGPCYVRVGGGGYKLATPEEHATVKFESFNWKDPVEFVVVAYTPHLACDDWDRMQLDWTRVPVEMQLVNFTGVDDDGPSYASTLNYVGTLETAPPAISEAGKAPDGAVAEWVSQLRGSRAELKKLVAAVDPRNFGSLEEKSSSYHVFAAFFALDYFTPTGKYVRSLRPFGKVLEAGREYRIGIRNLRTPKKCGLQQKAMEAPVATTWGATSGFFRPEYQFFFRAPASYSNGIPWADVPEHRRREWIEKEGAKRNPNVQLLKSQS